MDLDFLLSEFGFVLIEVSKMNKKLKHLECLQWEIFWHFLSSKGPSLNLRVMIFFCSTLQAEENGHDVFTAK